MSAMCSFPEPEAIESATSNSLFSSPLSSSLSSSFSERRGCVVSISMNLHFVELINGLEVVLSFTRIIFLQSI